MTQSPRWLITTADERTWKFDRPVIFLGEWCRIYDRKHIWQDMDAIVALPYGLGQNYKDADHAEARALEERLFSVLCDSLNQYHGMQHGSRFWRIVLGHWLRRYVDVIFNRVRTLDLCLQSYQLNGTSSFSDDYDALVPQDSYSAIWAFNDDRWNNVLYARLLNLLGVTDIPVEVVAGDEFGGFRLPTTMIREPLKRRILKWGYQQVKILGGFLARENDPFIINSYLPRKEEIMLQLALGKVPQLWTSPHLIVTKKPDRALRQHLTEQIAIKTSDTLLSVMHSLLFELLPICYLEGFAELTGKIQQLPWPKNPKLIFTSNNFDTDELFKIWTAHKIGMGVPYYVGQHGNYGVSRNHLDPSIEEFTSDKFLTWGWRDGLQQHTPAFIFKAASRKAEAYDPNGGLLLMELPMPHRASTWDGWFQYGQYFESQKAFVAELNNLPRNNLTVRLHSSYSKLKWCENERWRDFDVSINLDTGLSSLRKLIEQSRLIIFSYDSTGFLENLSKNIPTLAFWQNDFDHLRASAKPYYQFLVDSGIVHLTPESVAAKVNEVWSDVEGWWTQRAVQEARKQFCERYGRVSHKPVSELKKILLSDM